MRFFIPIKVLPWLTLLWHFAGTATAQSTAPDRPTIDLTGEWQFKMDPKDQGKSEEWFNSSKAFPHRIQVPGAWNAQGFRFESPEQLRDYERTNSNTKGVPASILGPLQESERVYSVFPGPAWYRRTFTLPADWKGKHPRLILEGAHREVEVWINGQHAGVHRSYLLPFALDLTPYARTSEIITITARVDARRNRKLDPLMGCLDTLDFVYISWGGLHKGVKVEAVETSRIQDIFAIPHLKESMAEFRIRCTGSLIGLKDPSLDIEVADQEGNQVASETARLAPDSSQAAVKIVIPKVQPWSPASPSLYTVRVRLKNQGQVVDTHSTRFGMREFTVANGKFMLNGKPIFLRGYGEDCIFPNTICPTLDKDLLRRRLGMAKEYGFNYVRHHSWTPPREYLEVADELGMMLQPEFPFAYGWDLPTSPEAKASALQQWEGIIQENRNHPSIVTWCMGNELYNSFDLAPAMYQAAKNLDPTRPVIDSDGCSFKHKDRTTLDFLVVQFGEGHSIGFNDNKYDIPKNVTKPVIAHEMGYFVTLPDLKQLDLFQRGIRPYWLIETQSRATQNGLLESYPDWLASSYKLQAASLKSNMEAARRSRLSGTSVWLFQDYPNCAEGVVDMFFRPKGVSAAEFRKYNSPTVLLLDVPRRNWVAGESLNFQVVVSRFEDASTESAVLKWVLKDAGTTVASGNQDGLRISSGEVQSLPSISWQIPSFSEPHRLTLYAELNDLHGKTDNSWDLWVYPPASTQEKPPRFAGFPTLKSLYPSATEIQLGQPLEESEVLITTEVNTAALDHLQRGGRAILLNPDASFTVEQTNFRLSSWDGGGPSGTQFNPEHTLFRQLKSEGWCDLQFYSLIQGSKTVMLDSLPAKIQPLIRCIDRPTRLANRAYLFEARMGRGKLLVSGFNFDQSLQSRDPAGRYLMDQMIQYVRSPEFSPTEFLPDGFFKPKVTP